MRLYLHRTLVLNEEEAIGKEKIQNTEFKFYISVFALLLHNPNVQVSDTTGDAKRLLAGLILPLFMFICLKYLFGKIKSAFNFNFFYISGYKTFFSLYI